MASRIAKGGVLRAKLATAATLEPPCPDFRGLTSLFPKPEPEYYTAPRWRPSSPKSNHGRGKHNNGLGPDDRGQHNNGLGPHGRCQHNDGLGPDGRGMYNNGVGPIDGGRLTAPSAHPRPHANASTTCRHGEIYRDGYTVTTSNQAGGNPDRAPAPRLPSGTKS